MGKPSCYKRLPKWPVPGEVKYLSNRRKRNRNEILLVVTSEQGKVQTALDLSNDGVVGRYIWSYKLLLVEVLRRYTTEGLSPVYKNDDYFVSLLSSVGHEKSGMNPPRPLGKTKYFFTPIAYSTVRER